MKFGKPLDFSDYPDGSINNRILINKLSQQVRADIQEMIMELLKERRSVWFG